MPVNFCVDQRTKQSLSSRSDNVYNESPSFILRQLVRYETLISRLWSVDKSRLSIIVNVSSFESLNGRVVTVSSPENPLPQVWKLKEVISQRGRFFHQYTTEEHPVFTGFHKIKVPSNERKSLILFGIFIVIVVILVILSSFEPLLLRFNDVISFISSRVKLQSSFTQRGRDYSMHIQRIRIS